jgi:hypothetical protein
MDRAKAEKLAELKAELKDLIVSVANLQCKSADIDDRAPLFGGPHSGAVNPQISGSPAYASLGLDSIDLLEVVVHIDKRFGLRLENNDRGRSALVNVESLALVLHDHLVGQRAVHSCPSC